MFVWSGLFPRGARFCSLTEAKRRIVQEGAEITARNAQAGVADTAITTTYV
jgi:hypothetical protein